VPEGGGLTAPSADDLDLAGLPCFRRIPHNIEAEMALLGAILVNQKAYERVKHFLLPEHFALGEHRQIYEAIQTLIGAGRLADPVVLKNFLGDAHLLDGIGGPAYLNRLVDCAVTTISAGEYGLLIYELAVRREFIGIGEDLVEAAYSGEGGKCLSLEDVVERTTSFLANRPGKRKRGLLKYLARDLHKIETKPRVSLLGNGNWLHDQCKCFLVGGDKSGKSILGMEMARAVAAGEGLLHWRAGDGDGPRRVLYLDGEMGLSLVKRRVDAMLRRDVDLGDLVVVSYDEQKIPPIETPAGHRYVLDAAEEVDAALVILDNFSVLTMQTLKEDEVIKLIAPLLNELVTRHVGTLSMIHTGHDKTRYAGSSLIGGITTGIIHLTRDPDIEFPRLETDVTWQSVREAPPDDGDFRPFRFAVEGDLALVEKSSGGPKRERPTKPQHKWLVEQLAQCLDRNGVPLAPSSVRPPNTRAVSSAELVAWFRKRRPNTSGPDATKMIHELIDHGFAYAEGDYVWRG